MRKLIHRTAALTLALVTLAAGSVHADVVQRGASAATTAAATGSGTSGGAVVDQNSVSTAETAVNQSSTAAVQVTTAAASHDSSVNGGAAKVVVSTLFDGDELILVVPRSAGQMISFVITTKAGEVLVFSGGTKHSTEHLKKVLRAKGGHVAAWFVTHPHSGHVGALTKTLQDPNSGIKIDTAYYNFQPQE